MQAHITDFSLHISRLLAPSSSGIVHSVYHRTINLMFHGRLAALQSRGSVLSPVSLLADQEDLLAATGELITPGIPVQITEDQGILFAGIPLESLSEMLPAMIWHSLPAWIHCGFPIWQGSFYIQFHLQMITDSTIFSFLMPTSDPLSCLAPHNNGFTAARGYIKRSATKRLPQSFQD